MADRSYDEEIVKVLHQSLLTRRGFLRGVGLGGAALVSAPVLAACGTSGAKTSGTQTLGKDYSSTEKVANFSNWPLYIDVDEKDKTKHPTLEAFQKQTGISVKYTEDVNDNDEFFGKIRPQLAAGQDTGRDLIVMTDWMAGRLVRLKYVEKLDKTQIPNASNLRAALQHPGFDPNRDYTLPWQSGLTGIAFNPKSTGGKEIKTVEQLLTDPDLKGKVTMLTEMRDTMGLILLAMGKDPANFSDSDFSDAIDKLNKAVKSKQIRQFTGNDYAKGLASGDIAACFAWSGDIIQLQADNPKIKFVTPDSGLMLWSDNMMIPNKARHRLNAEKLMNFYYEPKIAAQLADSVNYICPVEGAQDEMRKLDPAAADNQLIFPNAETLSKTHIFKALDANTEKKYTDQFQAVIGA